ncbi:hypothetical protein ACIO5Z_14425 [Streptomyces rochei]|uniref:hypothetical protein n=1 Tax=Streptomyces rochei TaxID=1928 RepID=UPI00380EB69A
MTPVAPASIAWIRLVFDGADLTLTPSPDIDLLLTVDRVEYDGYLDPLTSGPPLGLSMSVDLVPMRPLDSDGVLRCEAQARQVAAQLGVGRQARGEFTLEAALDGEGLPYNRVEAPRLYLASDELPVFDDEQPLPAVRVFTAKVPTGAEPAYTLRRAS